MSKQREMVPCPWPGCRGTRPRGRNNPYCREHMAEYRRELRRRYRAVERCQCGRETEPGRGRCATCREAVERYRASRAQRLAAKARARRDEGRARALAVGSALLAARMGAELTQRQVAERAGIAQQAYSRYERGASWPPDDALARISTALGVAPSELLATPLDPDGGARARELAAERRRARMAAVRQAAARKKRA